MYQIKPDQARENPRMDEGWAHNVLAPVKISNSVLKNEEKSSEEKFLEGERKNYRGKKLVVGVIKTWFTYMKYSSNKIFNEQNE